ncbi:MAG: hypothetical protein ACLRI8_02940 [Agathobacter rectalis]
MTATVSGNTATSVTKNADGTLTVTKEFTTDKRKIESVAAPTVPKIIHLQLTMAMMDMIQRL